MNEAISLPPNKLAALAAPDVQRLAARLADAEASTDLARETTEALFAALRRTLPRETSEPMFAHACDVCDWRADHGGNAGSASPGILPRRGRMH